jgi:hypothetical protein
MQLSNNLMNYTLQTHDISLPSRIRVTAKSEAIQKPPNFQDGYDQNSPVDVKSIYGQKRSRARQYHQPGR